MLPKAYQEFERIVATRKIRDSVLEIGAVPSDDSLLAMKPLANIKEKVGINLDGPFEYKDFRIVKGNSNSMECFADNRFDLVLCNAVLEHDMYFWKTIAEIQRVTRSGGLVVIGTPGYQRYPIEKFQSLLRKIPVLRDLHPTRFFNLLFWSTITYRVHDALGDYYRFSPQTFKEMFFAGMRDVEIRSVLLPPIIIGAGTKP